MNKLFECIPINMRYLGLSALAHANRHASYFIEENDKWEELSVIQAAHAAEILVKARIAQEHPLLIFKDLPSVSNQQSLTLEMLSEKGKTLEWSELPKVFKTITGYDFKNRELFSEFGYLRNSIQHFGIPIQSNTQVFCKTLNFIYSFIDPFINEHWGLYAIDYDEDSDSYEHLPITLIKNEIYFLVSPSAAECSEHWEDDLSKCSCKYRNKIKKQL